jgi:predicted enzyme related to lactoylglutathione lyase
MVEVSDAPDGTDFSRWLGYLSVADVEAAVARTRSAGGSVVIAPREVGQVGTAAVIRDPQGAPIGLLRIRIGDPEDRQRATAGSVGWNELLASDPESATAFYGSIAGYETRRIDRFEGPYHVLNDGIRDRAGVFSNPLDDTEPFWLTHFIVDDLLASTARVEELGGTVLLAPSDEFRDGRVALVMDPGGAVLVLRDGDPAGGTTHE